MQGAFCRPTLCIFCAFKDQTATFSTAASLLARTGSFSKAATRDKAIRSHAKEKACESILIAERANAKSRPGKRKVPYDESLERDALRRSLRNNPDALKREFPVGENDAVRQRGFTEARYVRTTTRVGSGVRKLRLAERDPIGAIKMAIENLEKGLHEHPLISRLGLPEEVLKERFSEWKNAIFRILNAGDVSHPLVKRLLMACEEAGDNSLQIQVTYGFYRVVLMSGFSKEERKNQNARGDLTDPAQWYPKTRIYKREFHLHVGPTNSGKTYQALKRLEEAKSGIYGGPLRLLAHEVYERLNAVGQPCNLITGDERKINDDSYTPSKIACTVEMVPLNIEMDVAVIDEIQMLADEDRGWAWTQVVLGVLAKEVHMCGEERTIPIIQQLAGLCGETLHIHRYDRLSPLQMDKGSLGGKLSNIRKGDAIVCFSIRELHAMRQAIEKQLKVKCAVIYGSLPPETRAQQARLFNDPDNDYDVLVASNAIGMGLNLNIKRVVFGASGKTTRRARFTPLSVAETKQIGGRAGRFSTAHEDMKKSREAADVESNLDLVKIPPAKIPGLVSTLEVLDYVMIAKNMESNPEPITAAGILPPSAVVLRFAAYFPPGTPFSFILLRLEEISYTNPRFFHCDIGVQVGIADAIESAEGLTHADRLTICSAPIETRKPEQAHLVLVYAKLIAAGTPTCIADVEELDWELLSDQWIASTEYLTKLENLHKCVIIWNWLSFRFPGVLIKPEQAQYAKGLVEKRIEETLSQLSFDYRSLRKRRDTALKKLLERTNAMDAASAPMDEGSEAASLDNSESDPQPTKVLLPKDTPPGDDISSRIEDIFSDATDAVPGLSARRSDLGISERVDNPR